MEVLMDEFIVYAISFDPCLENISKVLTRCINANLVINFEKCHFMQDCPAIVQATLLDSFPIAPLTPLVAYLPWMWRKRSYLGQLLPGPDWPLSPTTQKEHCRPNEVDLAKARSFRAEPSSTATSLWEKRVAHE
ncbi:hypothetical protein CR513_06628, partial [Mucuna pruriens]